MTIEKLILRYRYNLLLLPGSDSRWVDYIRVKHVPSRIIYLRKQYYLDTMIVYSE